MLYTDLNPAGCMGANCHLIEIGPFTLVIDTGINPKLLGLKAIPDFSLLEGRHIDLAILTHCHLDHLGALPMLLRENPDIQVLMSIPSEFLFDRMLHNSVNVMKRQREEHYIPEYPLYTHEEVDRLPHQVHSMPYRKPRILQKRGEELRVTLFAAGHVVGAAGVEIIYKRRRIFFTGDVLFAPQTILPGAHFPNSHIDTMVLETTRGATPVDPSYSRNREIENLLETIRNTLSVGGSVLIPVFALGRMQEILNIVHQARLKGRIPITPVFSSGLGMELARYIDKITKRTELCSFTTKVLRELKVKRVKRLKPGKRVAQPGLYICSSGMMVEHTPSYRVAASLLPFHHNSILFVGYCDPDTPGGKLLETRPGENYFFEAYDLILPMKARIRKFDLSGHANRDELMDYALSSDPRSVVLTHGDEDARQWFAEQFEQHPSNLRVIIPQPLTSIEV